MKQRRTYKRKVIEARSLALRDGQGWDSEFSVEEHDGGGVTETPFYLTGIFRTPEAAIQAAFEAAQRKIDSGFEYTSIVESR